MADAPGDDEPRADDAVPSPSDEAGARVAPDPETPAETLVSGAAAAAAPPSDRRGEPVPRAAASPAPAARLRGVDERYTTRAPLGRGGMGEVLLCRDHRIGRYVAMKRIRDQPRAPHAGVERRFMREARVQGQLEHPAIVPVYDLGTTPDGALYFTMKRVRGVSLADVLRGMRAGDGELAARYSQRRLLTLLSNVCLAVHFAHDKGVVHRDLKPSNIMLGDFGEVYVLDWGLAALRGVGDPRLEPIDVEQRGHTLGGGVMGTPGYMAPEQIRDASTVDVRADVYALGAILFELLTLQRRNGDGEPADVLCATLELDDVSPAARAPERDIPPELDRLCRDATRLDRAQRPASAKALSLAIEHFLDGDRDLALRRQMAAQHVAAAEQALAQAGASATVEHDERARAMREVVTALGLEPDNTAARRTLVRLITEPVETMPAEVEAQMAARALAAFRLAARGALLFYAGYLLYLPLLLWMGVRDWRLFALGWATIVACALATYASLRRPPARLDGPLLHLALSTFTVGTVSVLFGPYVLVPMLALGLCVSYTASVGHMRGLVPVASCLAVIVPAALQWLGVLPPSYRFEADGWIVLPTVFHISARPTQAFLLAAIVGTVVPACIFVARLRRAYLDAERKLQLQAWQLRQIVPRDD